MMPSFFTKKKLRKLYHINLIMYYTNVVGYKLRILIDLLKYDNIMSSKVWQSFDIKRDHLSRIYPLLCYDQNKN
jgi:hypothetical protein